MQYEYSANTSRIAAACLHSSNESLTRNYFANCERRIRRGGKGGISVAHPRAGTAAGREVLPKIRVRRCVMLNASVFAACSHARNDGPATTIDSFHRFRREIHSAIDPRVYARSETVKVDADYGTDYEPRAKCAYDRMHLREARKHVFAMRNVRRSSIEASPEAIFLPFRARKRASISN